MEVFSLSQLHLVDFIYSLFLYQTVRIFKLVQVNLHSKRNINRGALTKIFAGWQGRYFDSAIRWTIPNLVKTICQCKL
jgi:hypothetical protein